MNSVMAGKPKFYTLEKVIEILEANLVLGLANTSGKTGDEYWKAIGYHEGQRSAYEDSLRLVRNTLEGK